MTDIFEGEQAPSLSITIKYGKGYEETWAGFRGTPKQVREELCSYFGVDPEATFDLTLSELVVNCTNLAHGKSTVARQLDAVAIGSTALGNTPGNDEAQADPWGEAESNAAQAQPEPPADPHAGIREQVANATTTDELKRIWGSNQDAFTADAELLASWKAKGKSLKAAA